MMLFFPSQQSHLWTFLPTDEEIKEMESKANKLAASKWIKFEKTPTEIIPRLFLGSSMEACCSDSLEKAGITHVLCVSDKPFTPFPKVILRKRSELCNKPSLLEIHLQGTIIGRWSRRKCFPVSRRSPSIHKLCLIGRPQERDLRTLVELWPSIALSWHPSPSPLVLQENHGLPPLSLRTSNISWTYDA